MSIGFLSACHIISSTIFQITSFKIMPALSTILRFSILDAQGTAAQLLDLAISQLDTDYPPVTDLILRLDPRNTITISWDVVQRIDWPKHQIHVKGYDTAQDDSALQQAVWLRRDILDALILDLRARRVTRANDLWLDVKDGQLQLSAADTGARAILRRITHGRYWGIEHKSLYDWKYIEFLRGDPQAVDSGARYHRRIVHLPPGEIAHLASSMPYLHAAELLELLPVQLAAD